MPVLNDRALRPLYRKAGRALGQLNQRIDRWTRRYPTTTAVLFALLGWVLLWLALTGPSGSGKTYSALLLAKGIGGRIAVIDTEHGSASLYADVLDFDVLN